MYSISVNQKTKQLIADQINLHFIPQGTNAFLGGVHAQYAQEKKKRKKILPQSLNFVIRTKRLFSELQRLFVPVAFIFRLHNN